jgi:hypothetical protein
MRDKEKTRARERKYRLEKKIAKYGPEAADKSMIGRHGNQARGSKNGRWNKARLISSHGYVLIRVGKAHPMSFGNGYAYEHNLVMVTFLGRPLAAGETVHHKNGNKEDNRIENLEILSRTEHAKHHDEERGRDSLGRFPPKKRSDLRVRQMPTEAKS